MVTIKDIAREAGVSHPTVSLVLNGKARQGRISDKVAQKVLETAQKLGYTRNEIARSMATGKNEVIAFVSEDMGLIEYTGRIQNGILEEASKNNYSVKLHRLDKNNRQSLAKTLAEQRVSGMIFHTSSYQNIAEIHAELDRMNIPVATVNLENKGKSGFGVTTDDRQGAFDAVRHLARLGHRRIALMAHNSDREYANSREAGYLEGMRQCSDERPSTLKLPSTIDESELAAWFESAVRKARADGATAIFCEQDTLAMRVIRAAHRQGVRIPEDMSVVGFGGMDMGQYAEPPLTSVHQPFEEMGRLAVASIISGAGKKRAGKTDNMRLETKLVPRESSAKRRSP